MYMLSGKIKPSLRGGNCSGSRSGSQSETDVPVYMGHSLFNTTKCQFRPPIALRTDLSHITMELCEIPVLRMAH